MSYTKFTKVEAEEFKGNVTGNLIGTATSVEEDTPVNAEASTLSTDLAGDNNDLVFTAKVKGESGDDISITYVDPEEETAEEAVVVTGTDIVVTLRSVSATLSTATQVKAAIDGATAAAALVTVANKPANNGSGEVIAMAKTQLDNGVDGTVGVKGQIVIDADYIYVCTDTNTVADTNWKKVAIS